MKIPDYITKQDYNINMSIWDQKVLPAGTFVKPIDFKYVPQHVKDKAENKWFDDQKEIFVYCSYGILLIPKDLIRVI